jgi:hypothetical protein
MKRAVSTIFTIALVATCVVVVEGDRAFAQDRATSSESRPEIASATSVARANLRATIDEVVVAPPDVSVGAFVRQTNGDDRVNAVVSTAKQIGGPRWLDERTCQVRLSVPAGDVFGALVSLAADAGERSPVSQAQLKQQAAEWRGRTFSATGTSVTSLSVLTTAPVNSTQAAPVALPVDPPAWVGTLLDAEGEAPTAGTRLRTVRSAERVALADLRRQVEAMPVTSDKTVADVLRASPKLTDPFNAAMRQARVTKVDYLADGSVRLRVNLDASIVWRAITTPQP